MCGIVGFFAINGDSRISQAEIKDMTRAIKHRGPNDSGCLLIDKSSGEHAMFRDDENSPSLKYGQIGLGHRRLSILDLSERGQQPMGHSATGVWIVFNGEVYNYVELAEELKKLGHSFETTTDTEVVLKAYVEWGIGCFSRFNGMWGLAIYDPRSDVLHLSRDRFGKKPLYYYESGRHVLFSSEIKSLFARQDTPKEVNESKIVDYAGRNYRYVDDDDESFFKDINQVPKGHVLSITGAGSSRVEKYWDVASRPELATASEKDLVVMFRELLEDAVRVRLRSDVPVGCMLSGGMDSTSITCMASNHSADMHTFSGVTGTGRYDESEYIDSVVAKAGTTHKYIYPKPNEMFDVLREMMAYHDEPICTVTWYCIYVIIREIAKEDIPVILTGHGGDELLGGYWDHYHYNFHDIRAAGGSDKYEMDAWLANHGRDPQECVRERNYIESLMTDRRAALNKFSQYVGHLSGRLTEGIRKEIDRPDMDGELAKRLYLEMFNETIPASLRSEDRNMMAFSIENRVPFLDYRLADFCFNIGNEYKIRNGLGKWLLRESMKGILPEKVRTRTDKAGFVAPFDEWIRNENRAQMEELINARSYVNEEIYDHGKLKDLYARHLAGEDHYMFFWQYINLCVWHEQFWGSV
ncbi:asparagine synthase (glutamine-hydrolyzing) [Desulfovibrio sp. JC010]|uniref:asparagine synthase (glutamine-hydrolyzing) n=1 Tax=Desulfovibrio sp. JC010 TaxID=2593641 RepID=UPI0013D6DB0C|nr:asparagine synthase (glutamine-hydrolyzing) [Desulfovibrio sp. JC010]NDV27183.1 asparagine synthase (glutamine-hydrolyzing) [Desulfovibrio sp. JC010]